MEEKYDDLYKFSSATNHLYQVIQSDLFIPKRWRSLSLWNGHDFTIQKNSQTIARYMGFVSYDVLSWLLRIFFELS